SSAPTRSVTGGTATGSGSGSSTSGSSTTGSGTEVGCCRAVAPSRQSTTVDRRTATGPAGSVMLIVISSVVHVMPIAVDSSLRTAVTSDPGTGARSCGSSDTASPVVITLPISASRTVSGVTVALASRDPDTVTVRAAATSTGATTNS